MTVSDLLLGLGPADAPPGIDELGGEGRLLAELPQLDVELLPRFVEAVASDWDAVNAPVDMATGLLARLPEITGAISFATSADTLLSVTVATADGGLARSFTETLLAVAGDNATAESALRAGHALRGAVDLALLDVGVSPHGVLAAVENLEDIPAEMASGTARAVGRLWEHFDEPFLGEQLERRVLPHEEAAADGTVELGLKALRDAFAAHQQDAAADALGQAVRQFDRAVAFDENRPDARAFSAAAKAVLAFDVGDAEMATALDELTAARGELDRYQVRIEGEFRGATPLRSVAAWHVLAATLRGLRAHLRDPDVLNLRPAVEALADAYGGMRLGVLTDARLGLQAFIQPVIRAGITAKPALAEGIEQLAAERGAPPLSELAGAVVRPKAHPTSRGR